MESNNCKQITNVIADVCEFYGIHQDLFFADSHRQPGAQARQLVAYIMVRNLGIKNQEAAAVIGASKSYVSQLVRRWDVRMRKEIVREKFFSITKKY